MSMYGYVSLRLWSSSMRASQRTLATTPVAPGATFRWPRYVARPPSFETDLETIRLLVFLARWIALAPVSWCWPRPATATEMMSALAPSPRRQMLGNLTVLREPVLASIHSTFAFSYAWARLVTRL